MPMAGLKTIGSMAAQSLLAAAAFVAIGLPLRAETIADFYKGRSVPLVIGFSVGGGYDAYARLLARYIGKNIPGEPSIVPQPQVQLARQRHR